MRWLYSIPLRLRTLFNRRRAERDLDDELRFYFEEKIADGVRQGLTPEQARREARLALGGVDQVRESCRDRRGWNWLEHLLQDLRYATRTLGKSPGFTVVAVLTLALGIGANTAFFSLLDAVLLRSLPVQDPEELVFVNNVRADGTPNGAPPYPCFELLRDQTRSFTGIAAFAADDLNFTIDGRAEQVYSQYVSGNYFSLLGVKPYLGRLLTAEDEHLDPPVAVISYRYWQHRFGGDSGAIGKVIGHAERSLTIVGVSPPEFFGVQPGRSMDITAPITLTSPRRRQDRTTWWFNAFARLKPGISPTQARAQVDAIFQSFMATLTFTPDFRAAFDRMELLPASKGTDALRKRFSRPLLALMAIVGLVLFIGCANLANLFLARTSARRKEFAVRLAIGAGRGRLVRQLLTETFLLFCGGAVAGLLVARGTIALLTGFFAGGRLPIHVDAHIDLRVLAFTAAVTLLTGLVFGLAPAFSTVRAHSHPLLKDSGSRVTASRERVSARQLLVVAQVAFSLVLLAAAGLFIRTLANLGRLEAGFQSESVLTMSIQPLGPAYQGPRLSALWTDLLARVRTLPGVRSASLSRLTPLSGRDSSTVVKASGSDASSFQDQLVHIDDISDGYFETLGIPPLRGRAFTSADVQGSALVAIINEAAARFYFRDREPLGGTLEFGGNSESKTVYQIVGIVADFKHESLREEAQRFAFVPITRPRNRLNRMTLSLKAEGDPTPLLAAVRQRIETLGRDILITDILTMRQQVDSALVQERLMSLLSAFFGILALLLSAIGLYGTLSQIVIQRTSEIGIRMALGAARGNVTRMILRRSLLVVGLGIALGIPFALLAVRPIEALLYGLKPADAGSLILACSVLLAAGLLASYLPARRASRIDPMIALRHD